MRAAIRTTNNSRRDRSVFEAKFFASDPDYVSEAQLPVLDAFFVYPGAIHRPKIPDVHAPLSHPEFGVVARGIVSADDESADI